MRSMYMYRWKVHCCLIEKRSSRVNLLLLSSEAKLSHHFGMLLSRAMGRDICPDIFILFAVYTLTEKQYIDYHTITVICGSFWHIPAYSTTKIGDLLCLQVRIRKIDATLKNS